MNQETGKSPVPKTSKDFTPQDVLMNQVIDRTKKEIHPIIDSSHIEMIFAEAVEAMLDGDKIARRSWKDNRMFCSLRNSFLEIHKSDGWHSWAINDGDLKGKDWITINKKEGK